MAEAEAVRGGRGSLSLGNGGSGDPPRLSANGNSFPANSGTEDGVELSLGLSLNGKFGVDRGKAQKMKRSSSISTLALLWEDSPGPSLTRACSSPAAAEAETEESKKRKAAQSQKRMEAKRKRMEKLKGVRAVEENPHSEQNGNGNGAAENPPLPSSQVSSFVSQGSGSSGISDYESQPIPVKNSASGKNVEPVTRAPAKSEKDCKETSKGLLADMPCVSTKGEGPNGRRIEGFLYRYRKGEEVSIVCVCHGSFLSPAEFVKHAGGEDVTHPLKNIIVAPSCLV